MTAVLVTGAGGFIGSHVCEALLTTGYAVRGIDNFDPFYDAAVKRAAVDAMGACGAFSFVAGDVRDESTALGALTGCDAVIHCAARPGVRDSWGAADLYRAINVEGTASIIAACGRTGVRRLVFASSSSVYGNAPTPFVEETPLAPESPYAESKALAEEACRAFGRGGGSVAIVRLFSVYGPRLRPDLALHRFVQCLAADQPVPRFGDGTSARDYTHVSDAVRGLIGALEWTTHGQPCCEAFNVGSGRPIGLDELIATLGEVMGRHARIEALPRQRGDAWRTWADVSKAARALAYRPRVGLLDGLHSLRRWYEEAHGRTP